jgi:hypothetical protein
MKHLIGILSSAALVIGGGIAGGFTVQEPAAEMVVQATLLAPPRVPPPIDRPGAARVIVTLETTEEKARWPTASSTPSGRSAGRCPARSSACGSAT